VPTDRGYRFYVDHFTRADGLPAVQNQAVSEFFASAHQALEDLLHETSGLLARVSRHAAVVVGPQQSDAEVRSVQLVPLQPGIVLVVAVLSNGAVEKHVLQLDGTTDGRGVDVLPDDALVATANGVLDELLRNRTWTDLPAPTPSGNAALDEIVLRARDALATLAEADAVEPLYVGGVSRIAAEHEAFATAETAARLLEMLEHQVVVVSLVRELLDAGLSVSIGTENRLDELRDASIVVAPYAIEGRAVGIVGVLGPTRMDYRHALAAVASVSQQLGRHLS
jgi:heat-inducible transcriptional repressor